MSETTTSFRTCPLCEATCGVAVTIQDGRVLSVRGDDEDVFSRGYICPKATAIKDLEQDPDRLRRPLVKRNGDWVEVGFDEAFAEIDRRLSPIMAEHGRDAVAVYLGNPNVHNLDALLFVRALPKALGTRNVYSASTVDQRPKEISSVLMFGTPLSIPIPDIDRTSYLLMLGANPFESNGSLATAPDWPGRIKEIRRRGGRLVVVDPRRSRTAEHADEHVAIRPGTDALLLAGIANTLFAEGLVRLGNAEGHLNGLDDARRVLERFTPEAVAPACGIDASVVRRLARELAAAPSAAVYGRIGTTTQAFGTLASWLVDVCNILTGNLDRPGGAMWPKAAAGAANTKGTPGVGRSPRLGRFRSRVRGLPEALGELPVVCLAEEILTPGEGQVRALVTIAGNPALSTPDSGRLDEALASLEFMVAVDIYLNETTRHADVILTPPSSVQRPHYDLAFYQLSVRNIANYSPPALPLSHGQISEFEILSRLAMIAQGMGAAADPAAFDDFMAQAVVQDAVQDPSSRLHGCDPSDVLAAVAPRRGPDRILDVLLRAGPYGAGLNGADGSLSLDALLAAPHGIDLGPLEPRLPEVLRTASGRIELAPEPIIADLPRLEAAMTAPVNGGLLLVGRRHLRSDNSWLHNVPSMVKGRERCTLQVNPADADRLSIKDGSIARVTSAAGTLEALVEVTDGIREGVVSLPHGWGHDVPGVRMSVASAHAGVNSNILTDPAGYDAISGNAALNGIPVEVAPA